MSQILVRSVSTYQLSGWKLVVYRTVDKLQAAYLNSDVQDLVNKFRVNAQMTMPELVQDIACLDRIEQIEATDYTGNGFHVTVVEMASSP